MNCSLPSVMWSKAKVEAISWLNLAHGVELRNQEIYRSAKKEPPSMGDSYESPAGIHPPSYSLLLCIFTMIGCMYLMAKQSAA